MVKKLNRGNDGETSLPQPGSAPRSCAVVGEDTPTMAPRHRRRVEAHASRASGGPVARRANRRAQAAQWRPAPVVQELIASQPPAPDPYLAYLGKRTNSRLRPHRCDQRERERHRPRTDGGRCKHPKPFGPQLIHKARCD